jgi:hypothetical protein
MQISFLLLAVVIPAVAFVYISARNRSRSAPSASNEFRAVSIKVDPATACPAIMALDHDRHLCLEAPKLPLPECTVDACTCTFEHYADRRKGPRRAAEAGLLERPFNEPSKREKPGGRRVEDLDSKDLDSKDLDSKDLDPSATYYDFVTQTGIDPETAK